MKSNNSSKILITGSAGFIGFHLVSRFISEGYNVVGVDIINDYYDINLKFSRLNEHGIKGKTLNEKVISKSIKYSNYHFL